MYRAGRAVMICVLLATVILTGPAGMTPRVAAAEAVPVRLRIGVTADGIVQLTPSDLAAAGVDPVSVDPRTFAMSSMGQPVAIQVTGEADGSFDPSDRVLFFGQKFRGTQFQEKYTDERVYWLDIGGAAGPRIAKVDATPQGDLTPPQDVLATVHAEQNAWWWALHCLCLDTQDTWFWASLQPAVSGQTITATLPYIVPDPAPGYSAEFRLEAIGRAFGGPRPNHMTTVAVNGLPVIDQTWSDKQRLVFAATLPAGLLASGVNQVDMGARIMPGNYGDWVYANYWEVDYRRLFRAWQGQFDFRAEEAGLHEYVVDGWTSNQVIIWDVSDPNRPRGLTTTNGLPHKIYLPLISAHSAAQASVHPLRFRSEDAVGTRYWLQEATAFQHPTSMRIYESAGLRDLARGADTVIVTPADFLPAAQRLAAWHEAHNRRAVIADLQDIYDEFNEGVQIAPEAIPNMLRWGTAHWPGPAPAYLTLIGDGHWNMKGFNPAIYGAAPNHIPPYLAFVDPWVGEVPVDMRYGDLDGDGLPEVAVGRLTANSLAEADTVVGKIVNYDETFRSFDWQRSALFVADNPDAAGNFPALSDEIITNYLPSDITVTRAYLPGPEQILATRKVISETIQSGVWMVQYTGHGSVQFWAGESLLPVQDIPGFKNGERLPISMTFNCLDGYFVYPQGDKQSIAELMQRQEGGGAIAVISPTGEGITPDQQAFRRILMTVMFKDNVREIGKALDLAKHRYHEQNGAQYLIETMTLLGDPAMRLPLAAGS